MKIKYPTFAIVRFRSKTLANGENPVMIRVTFDRQRRYYSLGMSARPDNWHDRLGRYDAKRLTDQQSRANRVLDSHELRLNDMRDYYKHVVFTFAKFEKKYFNAATGKVFQYFDGLITELEQGNRLGSAATYRDTLSRLKAFRKKDITFTDIDAKFLQGFDKFLAATCSTATRGIYLRTLRAAFNQAIKDGVVKREIYPFGEFTIKHEPARKKALTKAQIDALKAYKAAPGSRLKDSINLFLFSYYARGMNLADIANLKWSDLHNGRLYYTRQKTGDKLDLPVDEKLAAIIAQYPGSDGYLFPILATDLPPKTIRHRLKNKLKKVNEDIRSIASELELPPDVTFYWARHTYATVLKRGGISISVIQETLGHSSEQVTKNYLDSFETSELDKIGELL